MITLATLKQETQHLKSREDDPLFISVAATLFKKICNFIISHSEVLDADSNEFNSVKQLLKKVFEAKPNSNNEIMRVAKNGLTSEDIQFMEMILDIFSIDINNASNISNSRYSQFGSPAFANTENSFAFASTSPSNRQ